MSELPRPGRPRRVIELKEGEAFCANCRKTWTPTASTDFNNGNPKKQCVTCREANGKTYRKKKETLMNALSVTNAPTCENCKQTWIPGSSADFVMSKGLPRKRCPKCRAAAASALDEPAVVEITTQICNICHKTWVPSQLDIKRRSNTPYRSCTDCRKKRAISVSLAEMLGGVSLLDQQSTHPCTSPVLPLHLDSLQQHIPYPTFQSPSLASQTESAPQVGQS